MTQTPFTMDPAMTAISIAYRNPRLIADQVLPRIPAVGKTEYGYNTYAAGTLFTVPDTHVGRRGKPTEVDFQSVRATGQIEDYALDDPIPQRDITNALAQGLANPVDRSVSFLTDLIALDREVRVAALVFALASYASDKRVTLSGDDQFSDADSDPIAALNLALDTPLLRPNKFVFGQAAWTATRSHADIVKAINKNDGGTGMVSRQAFADFFEVEEVIVGEARVNTARKGQAVSLSRTWGKHIAAIHINPLADTERGITFGMSVPFGQRVAGGEPDKHIGAFGGTRVRVAEQIDEIICAPDAGYFLQNAVA